jgi:hypothetical protein
MTNGPIILKDFDKGISAGPHKPGYTLLKNIDIESFPGAAKSTKKPGTYFHAITTQTFTADAASNECTTPANVETNAQSFSGAAVYFTTTGTLPAGLSTGTIYFLYQISSTVFKVCTSYKNSAGTAAGTVIDITDAGSGTHTINQVAIGTVNWIIEDPRTGTLYMQSSNGRVWFASGTRAYLLNNSAIDNGVTMTNANGNGIAINNFSSTTSTYLFVFRNALIDVIDVFGTTAIEALSWSNGWQTMNSGAGSSNNHHAIVGQDNIIYFTDDRYVGSIKENSGSTFDPATGGTYTYNNQALDTPSREILNCLEELGVNLLAGGLSFNKIYPWDRTSDSYNLPLDVPENSIYKMKNTGGIVYILAGQYGNIYTTQGSYVRPFVKIPGYLSNNASSIQSNIVTWGGIAAVTGALLVGVGTVTSGNSGVYRIFPDGRFVLDNIPSSGSAIAKSIWGESDFYSFGYSGGADNFSSVVSGSVLYSHFETVIQPELFRVATKTEKGKFSTLEVVTAKSLATGGSGSVRVSYRTNTHNSTAFTTIDTFTFNSSSDFTQENGEIGLTDLETIQFQIEMSGAVELVEVRFTP